MSGIAQSTIDSLITSLQSVANGKLNGRTFNVVGEDDLLSRSKLGIMPIAGVVYEGMQARPTNTPTHRIGLAANLSAAVLIFYKNSSAVGKDTELAFRTQALQLLDDIRATIRDTKGPSGHFWEFVGELPAVEKNGVTVWIQRWRIPVLLTT
jgi:hypothetical protein